MPEKQGDEHAVGGPPKEAPESVTEASPPGTAMADAEAPVASLGSPGAAGERSSADSSPGASLSEVEGKAAAGQEPVVSSPPSADVGAERSVADESLSPAALEGHAALRGRHRPSRRLLVAGGVASILVALTGFGLAIVGQEQNEAEVTGANEPPVALSFATAPAPAPPSGADAEAPSVGAAADAGTPPAPVWRLTALADRPGTILLEGPVGKQSLLAALVAKGIARSEVHRILAAFRPIRRFDRVSPKDRFAVAKDKATGRVLAFEFTTSPTDIWQVREAEAESDETGNDAGSRGTGPLVAQKLALFVETRRVAVAVPLGSDLRASVMEAGLDEDVLKQLDDVFEGHAELSDLRSGGRLRIVATEERVEQVFARYAAIEAVEYVPPDAGAHSLRVYRWSSAKGTGYYDAKGKQPFRGGFRSPVPLARISSRFNPRRVHPLLRVVMPHNGVDFAAPPGTPVYASASGTVRSVGPSGPCGNMVEIDHRGGLVTAYCHLLRFAAGLRAGAHVETRQLVGYVGQTGRATGPHLHFAARRGPIFIDPLRLKLDGFRVLPHDDRGAFALLRVALDEELDKIALPQVVVPDTGSTSSPVEESAETILDEVPTRVSASVANP